MLAFEVPLWYEYSVPLLKKISIQVDKYTQEISEKVMDHDL